MITRSTSLGLGVRALHRLLDRDRAELRGGERRRARPGSSRSAYARRWRSRPRVGLMEPPSKRRMRGKRRGETRRRVTGHPTRSRAVASNRRTGDAESVVPERFQVLRPASASPGRASPTARGARASRAASRSRGARIPIRLIISPPSPITIFFCEARSTSRFARIRTRSAATRRSSDLDRERVGQLLLELSKAASRTSSAARKRSGRSVRSSSG